ncbi:unnamed protein product [Heterobilharzia americana]|nr:unnamed protein product [Heterobilharzia americana]
MFDETAVHVLGGGIGGTVGAVLTCPLEVVKVRLQSSKGFVLSTSSLSSNLSSDPCRSLHFSHTKYLLSSERQSQTNGQRFDTDRKSVNFLHNNSTKPPIFDIPNESSSPKPSGFRRSVILRSLIDICRLEGPTALFKGLLPTLVGVLPSRGIYFCAYHNGQLFFEKYFQSGSSAVYLCAAGIGSITASSLTNPIWFVKTRLQLDSRPGHSPLLQNLALSTPTIPVSNYDSQPLSNESGPQKASDLRGSTGGSKLSASKDMILCMIASACSKAIAITALYPHEVVRTRLREESGQYRGFFRTLLTVGKEEGISGLYRGMATHYIRQVPNSCIMIGTYEFVVFLLQSWDLTKDTRAQ